MVKEPEFTDDRTAMSPLELGYFPYWGKTRPREDSGLCFHRLVYHCLDVAAVGDALLDALPGLRRLLASQLGLEEAALRAWALFFLSIHDLGKFSEAFQSLSPESFLILQGREPNPRFRYSVHHDSLGYALWEEYISHHLNDLALFPPAEDKKTQRRSEDALSIWARAVTGHHGQPPKVTDKSGYPICPNDFFTPEDMAAACDFVTEAASLFLEPVTGSPLVFDPRRFECASWWLAGFAVLCDWIGSGLDWACGGDAVMPPVHYWQQVMDKVRRVLPATGLLPPPVFEEARLDALLPEGVEPRPMQNWVAQCPVDAKPTLFILEDLTGSGKTEAALHLAHRLMAAGAGEGVYIGLPTMATANAMFNRTAGAYRHFYTPGSPPSLVLAHGARHMVNGFRHSILPMPPEETDYQDEQAAANWCSAWLADHRKASLLAQVGVGTVDQALLSILPVKHQSLRLLGLSRKVLIVDEVHAYDMYTHRLLQTLLTFHGAVGGSVILLSATLPYHMKQELVNAWQTGAGGQPIELQREEAYPSALRVDAESALAQAVGAAWERNVEVSLIQDEQAAVEQLLAVTAAGGCACWLRNSVDDAVSAYRRLQEQGFPGEKLFLFHARFTLGDRLVIEDEVLSVFGKHGDPATRQGSLLIATQVVEQSLDLDFDHMVTDLAPMDALIQRMGRVHRHARTLAGVLCPPGEADQRGVACLTVLSPLPVDQPRDDWLASFLPRAAKVYPDHAVLWRTARLLARHSRIAMPADMRVFIEEVFHEDAEVPPGLEKRVWNVDGEKQAERGMAAANSLKLEAGYQDGTLNWWDDVRMPTRLGEPTVTFRLARLEDSRLVPWCKDMDFPWEQSQVQVREYQAADEFLDGLPADIVQAARDSMPDKGKWSKLLVVEQGGQDFWAGKARNGAGEMVMIEYNPKIGLGFMKEKN